MMTHIAQPTFIGPSPAETMTQNADVASRNAAILQQGISDGMKNYVAMQQITKAKQMQDEQIKATQDNINLQILAKQAQDGIASAGPQGALQFFNQHQDDVFKPMFTLLAHGNPDLASSMMASTMKAYAQNMGVGGALMNNLVSISSGSGRATPTEGQASTTPVVGAAAPTTPAQPSAPQGMNIPTTLDELGNEGLVHAVANNPVISNAFRQYEIGQGYSNVGKEGDATKNAALIAGNKADYVKFISQYQASHPNEFAQPEGQAAQPNEPPAHTMSNIIRSELPESAMTQAAADTLMKMGTDPTSTVSAKGRSAVLYSVGKLVKVFDTPQTEQYLKSGGTIEQLKAWANNANDQLEKDPQSLQFLNSIANLGPDITKIYETDKANNEKINAQLDAMGIRSQMLDLQAQRNQMLFDADQAKQALAQKTMDDRNATAAIRAASSTYNASMNAFTKAESDSMTAFMKQKGAKLSDYSAELQQQLADPTSHVSTALAAFNKSNVAYSTALGMPVDSKTIDLTYKTPIPGLLAGMARLFGGGQETNKTSVTVPGSAGFPGLASGTPSEQQSAPPPTPDTSAAAAYGTNAAGGGP